MLTTTARAILLGALLCLNFQYASSQAVTWANKIDHGDGTNGGGIIYDVAVDVQGNTIVAGGGGATVDFGSGYSFSDAGTKGYLAKYDPQGTLLWAKRLFATGGGYFNDVLTAANGDIYFCTNWSYAQDFWGIQVAALPQLAFGGIVGKMDAAGNMLWVQTFPGTGSSSTNVWELKEASNGDVFVGLTFTGTLDIGGQTLTSQGAVDLVLARMTSSGNVLWTEQVEGDFGGFCWSSLDISADPNDNLSVSVFLRNSATVGTTTHTDNGNDDALLFRLDGNGNVLWSLQVGGPEANFPYGVGTDALGNTYWTGEFRDSIVLDGTTYPITGGSLYDVFFAKVDPNGNFVWATTGGGFSNDDVFDLAVMPNGDFYSTGRNGSNTSFGQVNLQSVNTIATYNVIKGDANGNFLWGATWGRPNTNGVNNGNPSCIALDPNGNPVIAGYFTGLYNFNGVLLEQTGNSADGFVARLLDNSNLITGEVYRDFNQNGSIDPGDNGFPGAIVEMTPGPRYYFSGTDGGYFAGTGVGNFSLSIPNPPMYHTVTAPTTHAANFAGLGQVDSLNDFGIYPIPNSNDLRLSLDNVHPPRPGDTIYYQMRIKNVGTTTQVPDLSFLPASQLNFLGATPNFQSTTNDTLFWTLPSLAPQAESFVVVAYTVPLIPTIQLGDTLNTYAQVEPISNDLAPLDNVGSLTEIIVGSYDPNDKAVSPSGDLDPADVAAGMWLEYKIRFQNTGTDTAFQVVVRDTLDMDLDIASFEMLSASHDYDVYLSGPGELAWRFNNINLPDSNVNEAASHGFIRYRIRPRTTLSLGTVIENTAHIYFDYNPAIVTNTTVNTVFLATAFADPAWSGLSVQVYPNPSEGRFKIALDAAKAGSCATAIYDLQGRKLMGNSFKHGQGRFEQLVDAPALPAGVYVLEIESEGAKLRQRIVLR